MAYVLNLILFFSRITKSKLHQVYSIESYFNFKNRNLNITEKMEEKNDILILLIQRKLAVSFAIKIMREMNCDNNETT